MKFICFLFRIYLILSLLNNTTGYLVATSNLELCTNESSQENEAISCQQKIVISISLENSQANGTESVIVIESVKDENSDVISIEEPFEIYFEKSQVKAFYVLNYKQEFNYAPYETVVESSIFDCSDGVNAESPTCGWVYNSKNEKVPNSQGFCCDCEFFEILGITNEDYTRAKDCGDFNFGEGSSTAHCLRFNDLWYSAYEIEEYTIYYQIGINIVGNGINKLIQLDTSDTISFDEDLNILAKIVGDFYPTHPPPTLSHLYLFIPSSPSTHAIVKEGTSAWMFINPSEVTLDGTECNKIGVSFEAFQTHNLKCEMPVGTCLENQLKQKYLSDIEKISANEQPDYFIKSKGNFNMEAASTNNDQVFLSYNLEGTQKP